MVKYPPLVDVLPPFCHSDFFVYVCLIIPAFPITCDGKKEVRMLQQRCVNTHTLYLQESATFRAGAQRIAVQVAQ